MGHSCKLSSRYYHLLFLRPLFLVTRAVDDECIELPKIMDGEREDDNNENLIYRNEYNQLPQDVREYFAEATNLIDRANQAAKAEEEAVKEYNLIHTKINTENQNGMQLVDLKENVENIEETEEIASRIIEAQTFWIYEGVPAPGDNEKLHMDTSTSIFSTFSF